jgi:MFS family permease
MTTKPRLVNRWLLAGAGVLMQLAFGAVYAWSVFLNPLVKTFGWSNSEVTLTFSIAILVLGFASFLGGLWMTRVGPRTVGIAAGICYGLGVALSSLSTDRVWVLYLSYGVLGGVGLGLGYIGFGGLLGPLLIARIREVTGSYGEALTIIASVMLVSSLLPLAMGRRRLRSEFAEAS